VTLGFRDVLHPARLHRGDPLPVDTLAHRDRAPLQLHGRASGRPGGGLESLRHRASAPAARAPATPPNLLIGPSRPRRPRQRSPGARGGAAAR
jgi:hypothetical protein